MFCQNNFHSERNIYHYIFIIEHSSDGCAAFTELINNMKLSKSVRHNLQLQRIAFVVLLLSLMSLLSWLSQVNSVQYDWSANSRNSISQQSVDILNTMDDDIVVNVYVQNTESVQKAVTEILQRYQRVKNNFIFKLINPDIDIALSQSDNIKQYGQVVIKYKDKKEIVSSLSEQTISSALLRLSHTKERNIAYLTGHSERNPEKSDNTGYSTLTKQLQSNGFLVKTTHLLKDNISPDTTLLVIASPSNKLLDGEIEKIQTYITNGGNLLWMADPGELQNLEPLAKYLGINFLPGLIVDNNIDLRKTLQIEHPAIIPVVEYYPHAITNKISYNTLFPTSRGITIQNESKNKDWNTTPLFASFSQSWSESKGLSDKIIYNTSEGDIPGPITIAMSLEREINNKDISNKASQRIVVIGDSDFLANSYIGAGANLSLGLNIYNWLSDDNDLISIAPRGAPDTQLEIHDAVIAFIGIGFFVLIPLILVITGFALWFKRKRA